jgi:hypothetical protein
METLEKIYYKQVILEGRFMDWLNNHGLEWIKDHASIIRDIYLDWIDKHGGHKQVIAGGAGAVMVASSPVVMAAYFHKFLQHNPDVAVLPSTLFQKLCEFIAQQAVENPNFLEFLKKIAGH